MTLRTVSLSLVAVAVLAVAATAQSTPASELYFEALRYQENKGDLAKAIDAYKTLVERYPTDAIAPKALLELARCYEKTGQAEASGAFARLVREYPNSDAAGVARTRLAAEGQRAPTVTVKQIWESSTDWVVPDWVSSDGEYLSFVSDTGDVAIREIPSGRVRRVTDTGTENINFANFAAGPIPSRDGKFILYAWFPEGNGQSDLRIVSRNGGTPRVVVPNPGAWASFSPIGWTADRKRIVFVHMHNQATEGGTTRTVSDVMVVGVEGGTPRLVKRFDDRSIMNSSFRVSPVADFVAFDVTGPAGQGERNVFVMSLTDGNSSPVVAHLSNDRMLDWFPTGDRLLFLSDRGGEDGAWSVGVSNGRAQGEPLLVRANTGRITAAGFTARGEFYYWFSTQDAGVRLTTLDPASGREQGPPKRLEGRYQTGQYQAAWSPDGSQIAYIQATKFTPGVEQLREVKLAIQTIATNEVRLMNVPGSPAQHPTWMPDGSAVIVSGGGYGQDGQGIYRIDLPRGRISPLAVKVPVPGGNATDSMRMYPVVSKDGGSAFFRRTGVTDIATRTRDSDVIAVRDLASGTERTVFPTDPGSFALSPDGRWIAVRGRDSGTGTRVNLNRIVIIPSAGGDARATIETTRSAAPYPLAWSQDGESLFVFRYVDGLSLWQVPIDGAAPRDTGIRVPGGVNGLSVHKDGRTLAISNSVSSMTTWVMQGIAGAKR